MASTTVRTRIRYNALRRNQEPGCGRTLEITDQQIRKSRTEQRDSGAEQQLRNIYNGTLHWNRKYRGRSRRMQYTTTRFCPVHTRDLLTRRQNRSFELRNTWLARVYRSSNRRQRVAPRSNNNRATENVVLIRCGWRSRKNVASWRCVTMISARRTKTSRTASLLPPAYCGTPGKVTIKRLHATGGLLVNVAKDVYATVCDC